MRTNLLGMDAQVVAIAQRDAGDNLCRGHGLRAGAEDERGQRR